VAYEAAVIALLSEQTGGDLDKLVLARGFALSHLGLLAQSGEGSVWSS
jgi:hypothetical protein